LSGPVLLKLDLQGNELAALQGAQRVLASVQAIVVEAVFREIYVGEPCFNEVWSFLHANGFKFKRPLAFTQNSNREIVQIDALFEKLP